MMKVIENSPKRIRIVENDYKYLYGVPRHDGVILYGYRDTIILTPEQCRVLSRWLADRADDIERAKIAEQ